MSSEVRDPQTVTPAGEPLQRLPEGVRFRDAVTHPDARGTVVELFDPRWQWGDEPLVYSYCWTLRPGMIKGWALHRKHSDRYVILFGELEVVLYDERPDSPTRGLVAVVPMTEHRRRLMTIPPGVWHADRNIGDRDAVVVNFPTAPYDHEAPDKYRLPIDTDRIPYRFDQSKGW